MSTAKVSSALIEAITNTEVLLVKKILDDDPSSVTTWSSPDDTPLHRTGFIN